MPRCTVVLFPAVATLLAPSVVTAAEPLAGLEASIAEVCEVWQASGLTAGVVKNGEGRVSRRIG